MDAKQSSSGEPIVHQTTDIDPHQCADSSFDDPSNSSMSHLGNQNLLGCHYEPIYRRQGTHFVPAGHKAVIVLNESATGGYGLHYDPNNEHTSHLMRLGLSGVPQIDIIKTQLDGFLAKKKLQPNQKMVFELDSADLARNPFTMDEFAKLVDSDPSNSLKAEDIVIELSCASDIDRGDLYSVTYQLKQIGVMIALIDQDADAFSYSKIIEIKPNIVKFNRSWCNYDLSDIAYLQMVKDIVRNLNADGTFVGLTGIRRFREFKFAAECGFTRCQGRYLGIPSAEMVVGESIIIPS